MNKNITSKLSILATAVMALAFSACSSLPADNATLMEARAAYSSADNDPRTRELAASEMAQAKTALERADHAFKEREKASDVSHLAYEAKQRVAIANEVAKRKIAEQSIAQASAERDKIRLEGRTREADQARQSANVAQSQATAAQNQAMLAQQQAEAAKRQAESAQNLAAQTQARNAQLMVLMQELNAKKTERGMVVTIGDVLFDTNEAQLKPGGMRNIEKLGALLKDDTSRRVQVEGFTDSTGSKATNDALSTRRAESVRAALIAQGVAGDRVNARGMGEAYPVAGNDNAAGRQANRRVEVILSDPNGNIAQR